jgi:predicted HTH transcriptional regulator
MTLLLKKKLISEKLGHLYTKSIKNDFSINLSDEISESDIESSIEKLIAKGESCELEFKSSLKWCLRENRADKKLESIIMKSIAAFSNGHGGTLLIGINDNGEVIGLKNDFSILGNNRDGFELHLRELIKKNFKETFATNNIKITFCAIQSGEICVLQVKRGYEPVYIEVQDKTGNKTNKLYVRSGNSSIEIPIEEVSKFLSSRFTIK